MYKQSFCHVKKASVKRNVSEWSPFKFSPRIFWYESVYVVVGGTNKVVIQVARRQTPLALSFTHVKIMSPPLFTLFSGPPPKNVTYSLHNENNCPEKDSQCVLNCLVTGQFNGHYDKIVTISGLTMGTASSANRVHSKWEKLFWIFGKVWRKSVGNFTLFSPPLRVLRPQTRNRRKCTVENATEN